MDIEKIIKLFTTGKNLEAGYAVFSGGGLSVFKRLYDKSGRNNQTLYYGIVTVYTSYLENELTQVRNAK